MKIAALQMVSTPDIRRNLDDAAQLVAQAAHAGAELVALPEYFCLMGLRDADKVQHAEEPGEGPIQRMLAGVAREHGIWVVGGTLPLRCGTPGRVRNASLVFGPDGAQVARYDKIHLFRFDNGKERYDEARTLEPGDEPIGFDMRSRDGESWRVGLSVCYDLRFPELYRALRADLILVPSAFTWTTGQAHWTTLLRARAIENLCYVLAPAQGGRHENGRRTFGHSLVADPWGELLATREEGAGVVLADADLTTLRARRAQLPALEHQVL